MSLADWLANRWLVRHEPSRDEIEDLLAVGYRPGRERGHERAIQSLQFTVGSDTRLVDTIDGVRRKRNISNYERAGTASASEAREMYAIATLLRDRVVAWLNERHPDLHRP